MLEIIIAAVVVIGLGFGILEFGPQGWRTHILGAIVGACPVIGEILNYLGAFDLSKIVTDTKLVAGIGAGIGILIIIFNAVNKKLYGSTPRAAS